jgi:hypothetical protein
MPLSFNEYAADADGTANKTFVQFRNADEK